MDCTVTAAASSKLLSLGVGGYGWEQPSIPVINIDQGYIPVSIPDGAFDSLWFSPPWLFIAQQLHLWARAELQVGILAVDAIEGPLTHTPFQTILEDALAFQP